jgi:hypothetical protein
MLQRGDVGCTALAFVSCCALLYHARFLSVLTTWSSQFLLGSQ